MIPRRWQRKRVGDFLTESRVPGSNGRLARKITVKLYGKGVAEKREKLAGSENTPYYVRRAGQLIYSKLDFLNGAFGIVPPELDKFETTLDLPCFDISGELVPEWLIAYLTRPAFYRSFQGNAKGSRKARRINQSEFLDIELIVPPLPEQRKIAAILGSVDEAIQATQAVIDQTRKVKHGLIRQFLATPSDGLMVEHQLGNLISAEAGVSVNSEDRTKADGEFGILKISSVTYGKFDPMEHKTILAEELPRARVHPRKDTILVSRANTAALVGASAFVDRDFSDLFLPDKLWQVGVNDPSVVSVRWLSYYLASKATRAILSEMATGTSASMKNISKAKFLSLSVPLPPLEKQNELVTALQAVDSTEELNAQKMHGLFRLKRALSDALLTGRIRVEVPA